MIMMKHLTLLPTLLPHIVSAQLNSLAKQAALQYFGSVTDNPELSDAAYVSILSNTSEFGQITPGNAQKWDTTEPSQGQFSFAKGDAIVDLAESNGQLLRCHTLVWHSQLPSWVSNSPWTPEALTAVIQNHVTNVVTHYKGRCHAWDVVNEALNDDGTFRASIFHQTLGEDFIRIAFEAAALADPAAKLHYNDYDIEAPGPKASAVLRIVQKLQVAKVKIDGVGMQSHFVSGQTPSRADLVASMEAFAALDVEVVITELDVRVGLPRTRARLEQQARDYESVVGACMDVTSCVGITVWDFTDQYSWIPPVFPGQIAALPFDDNLDRKPAYRGIAAALKAGNTPMSRKWRRYSTRTGRMLL